MEQEFRLHSQISYYIFFYPIFIVIFGTQDDKDWGMGMGNWYGGGRQDS